MKIVSALLCSWFLAVPASAVLGQPFQSVQSDQQRMRGELRSVVRQGYTAHEITAPDGMTVSEYVAPNGVVFGVSWQGPTLPDLKSLLGSYFSDFQQAAVNAPARRRAVTLRTDRVVVESGGHMRSFHGRAFVPSLLPANAGEEVVQ